MTVSSVSSDNQTIAFILHVERTDSDSPLHVLVLAVEVSLQRVVERVAEISACRQSQPLHREEIKSGSHGDIVCRSEFERRSCAIMHPCVFREEARV